jgi:polysaccharide deacetylase 2 family uncharacterized protein YibQ
LARPRVSSATLFFALLSLALGVALYLKTRPAREREPQRPAAREAPRKRPAARAPAPIPGRRPLARIAIVIDDLGNDREAVARIARLSQPVAGAVLPSLSGSAEAARALSGAGKEVLLHLPMEPRGYPDVRPGPGPGVIVRAQSEEEIVETLSRDLASVPGAVGVNNHMGSAATADERVMRAVLEELSHRGLFFLDSRTTDATIASDMARATGVPVASRGVFLDAVATREGVEASLTELVGRARRDGSAIAVGHPYPATLAVLERELPRLSGRGVRVVRVGELVRRETSGVE